MPGPTHWPRYGTETAHAFCGNPDCGQRWPCLAERGMVAVDKDLVAAVIHVSSEIIRQTDPGLGGLNIKQDRQRWGHGIVRNDTLDALAQASEALGTATFGAGEAAAL